MKTNNKLGLYLKQKRQMAGLSQAFVANKLGYSSPQFVSNWERGVSEPPIETLKKLSAIYEIDVDELFEITLEHIVAKVTDKMRSQFFGKARVSARSNR